MKRALKWVGLVVALLVLIVGSGWCYAFSSNKPIVEGPIVPGVETVRDPLLGALAGANVFILDAGPGKVALVDAGNDKSGAALLAALAKRNLTPAAVSAIFLTHGHPDHTAGCKLFPAAEVYAMEPDVALVGDAAKVAHPLKDGDVITVGDLSVEAFSVPGHTPGSAVYLARGVLFFGDSAGATKDGELKKAVGLFSKDSAQNVASLKALASRLTARKQDIKAMAFGHTGSLPGMDQLLAFASR
jgi:glyoxylase-like metal-dependent hydrolase (beta-lactamase superfamily II)